MKYIHFGIQEFVEDEDFIHWVKNPNPQSDIYWDSFLTEYPEKRNTIAVAREIVETLSTENKYLEEEEVLRLRKQLISNFNKISSEERESEVGIQGKFVLPLYFKIAASLLLLFIAAATLFFIQAKHAPDKNEQSFIEKESIFGRRTSVVLPDGSKVWLNGGSKVSYLKGLEKNGIREVFLEGEAFFEVAKNKHKPFIVNTRGLKIKVLGTKFNVKSYQLDPTIETTLVEGSVSIDEKKDPIILKPNEKAIFSKSEKNIELVKVDPLKEIAWKDGYLVVENENLTQVIHKLERWYGVDLELKGGANCKLQFRISGESLTEVLENIKVATNMSYHTRNNTIVIEASDCK